MTFQPTASFLCCPNRNISVVWCLQDTQPRERGKNGKLKCSFLLANIIIFFKIMNLNLKVLLKYYCKQDTFLKL
jgi:hypothetical protein